MEGTAFLLEQSQVECLVGGFQGTVYLTLPLYELPLNTTHLQNRCLGNLAVRPVLLVCVVADLAQSHGDFGASVCQLTQFSMLAFRDLSQSGLSCFELSDQFAFALLFTVVLSQHPLPTLRPFLHALQGLLATFPLRLQSIRKCLQFRITSSSYIEEDEAIDPGDMVVVVFPLVIHEFTKTDEVVKCALLASNGFLQGSILAQLFLANFGCIDGQFLLSIEQSDLLLLDVVDSLLIFACCIDEHLLTLALLGIHLILGGTAARQFLPALGYDAHVGFEVRPLHDLHPLHFCQLRPYLFHLLHHPPRFPLQQFQLPQGSTASTLNLLIPVGKSQQVGEHGLHTSHVHLLLPSSMDVVHQFAIKPCFSQDLLDDQEFRDSGEGLAVAIDVIEDAVTLSSKDAPEGRWFELLDDVGCHLQQVASIAAVLDQATLVGEVEAFAVEVVEDAFEGVPLHFLIIEYRISNRRAPHQPLINNFTSVMQ